MRPYTNNGGFIGITVNYTDEGLYPDINSPATITYVGGITGGVTPTVATEQDLFVISLAGIPMVYGDMVIVAYERCGTSTKVASTIPGYTTIASLYISDTEDSNLIVAYKFMDIIPDTTVTLPPPGFNGLGGVTDTDAGAAIVQVWRGVDINNPLDVVRTTSSLGNTAVANPPAITPITAGSMLVVAGGSALDTVTNAAYNVTYLSNFVSRSQTDTNSALVGMGNIAWTSGAYDPAAWEFTISHNIIAATGGTGTGANFNIVRGTASTGYTVTVNAGGSGYTIGDTLTIVGTLVGGANPANNITITVTEVTGGAITAFTIPTAGTVGNTIITPNSGNYSTNAVTMALRPGFAFVSAGKKNSGVWDIPSQVAFKQLDVSGDQDFLTAGSFLFEVPESVFTISAIAIGGGGSGGSYGNNTDEPPGGGGGGALAYGSFSVTPGEVLTIVVANGGPSQDDGDNGVAGADSSVFRGATRLVGAGGGQGGISLEQNSGAGGAGGVVLAGIGFAGGAGGTVTTASRFGGGGGGAGGYFGIGGTGGGQTNRNGTSSTGGGGGGGAALSQSAAEPESTARGGGGGVGIYGPSDPAVNGAGGVRSNLFSTVTAITPATFNSVTTTNVTGVGTGATFNVTRNAADNGYTVTLVNGGTGYSATLGSNTIRILGTAVGGATTANDITITITAVDVTGVITAFTIPAAGAAGNLSAGSAMTTVTVTSGTATAGTGGPYIITNASAGVVVTNGSGGTAPSGTWSLSVTRSGGVYSVSVTTGGTAFGVGDTIYIPYTLLEGLNPSGTGGSGGTTGTATGGTLGGGGRGGSSTNADGQAGGLGAVRLVWGQNFSFPGNAPNGIIETITQGGINYLPQIDQY